MTNDPTRAAAGMLNEYGFREGRERSMADVVGDIIGNVQEMVRSEIRLARAEVREEVGKSASSAKLIGIGAGMALFALGFFLVAITQALALFMPAWAASLVMAVVLGGVGGLLLVKGRDQFRVPTPDKTIANVKENVEWMKNQSR